MTVSFSRRELLDLGAAWVALSVAFTLLVGGGPGVFGRPQAVGWLTLSLFTVGVGFLLHELAHKVTAVHFGKRAEFKADYGMLFVAVAAALAGFFFAAPGAVYHAGHSTERQNGLIALAGPVTNIALAALFVAPALLLPGFLGTVGVFGVGINIFLAGFNMLPVGPLDGRTVWTWNKPVFLAVFLPSAGLSAYVFWVAFL
ncbi:MAG: metalloprotease [Halorientalis sp.]